MYQLCTIGHITLDKIQTPGATTYMPGGTGFYMVKALKHLDVRSILVTAIGAPEQYIIDELQGEGLEIVSLPSKHTVYFENIYGDNPDHREQNVLNTADAFTTETLPDIPALIYHLGPLLAGDFSVEFIQELSMKGSLSLDVQGMLRHVKDRKVSYHDWADKTATLPYIGILKANEFEAEIVTGESDPREAARYLAGLGANEIIITLGSRGSLVFTNNLFYDIPAFAPEQTVDTTGCGDTYMAGYLYQRVNGATPEVAGTFAAAMATLKIQSFGPFTGSASDINMVTGM